MLISRSCCLVFHGMYSPLQLWLRERVIVLYHCAIWACAHLKPSLPVSLLLYAVASRDRAGFGPDKLSGCSPGGTSVCGQSAWL